ncbi:MAG TPA: bifunctional riboflavin kinase/FAD synthetase [Kineosporiaceae bacterium]|nr:bifunctional riboflavin kinase/FAD synthetase [Kineosporiaceae bacterium]
MQRWNGIDDVPAGFGPSVVTIGNFDGVHRGHRAVLTRLVERAREDGWQAVAITFWPHPAAVLFPERAPVLLDTLDHKLELMAATGLDAVLVMEFTKELAGWSPERFVQDVLVDVLGARLVVVGRDTRFGHRNAGDVNTLRDLGGRLGFEVELLEDLGVVDGGHPTGRRWSSTWVRSLVATGEVAEAAAVLDRPSRVTGAVVHGDHRGRELGFPTANLASSAAGVVPADGVYAGWLIRPAGPSGEPERLPAAISIGTNPTFDGNDRRVEAYVLDRDDLELYGETVAVEFVDRLRPTLRFTDIGALVRQMKADVEQCRQVLAR